MSESELEKVRVEGWISLRDFAVHIAQVTYMTARRWASLDMINYTQVGGQKRIYEIEIKRFLKEGTLPPNPTKHQAWSDARKRYKSNSKPRGPNGTAKPRT